MKKRILSFLLACFLMADMIPWTVFAQTDAIDATEPTEAAEIAAILETEAETKPTVAAETTAPVETVAITEPTIPAETTSVMETTDAAEQVTSQVPALSSPEIADNCPYCVDTLAEDGSVLHADTCNAEFAYDGAADVGRYVRLIPETAMYSVTVSADPTGDDSLLFYYSDFGQDTVMRIADWYWDSEITALWYRVELHSGAFPEAVDDLSWPDPAWILQTYTDSIEDYGYTLEFVTVELPDDSCEICGKEDCTGIHTNCSVCEKPECGLTHPYCNVCEIYDCTRLHTWCGSCGDFDCVLTHGEPYRPMTEPVIPENPVLPREADGVFVLDESGYPVPEQGLFLTEGIRTSLSAWSGLENASYQWQIRYDEDNNRWADIQGQKEQGILVSPAMFRSILEAEGSTALRCVVKASGETLVSAAMPVYILVQTALSAYSIESGVVTLAEEETPDLMDVSTVVVQYVYSDGRTAAATKTADIISGTAITHVFDVPEITGYQATLRDAASYGTHAALGDKTLTVTYAEGELTAPYTILVVEYVPALVKYTVIHYWQNTTDDYYAEHEREVISDQYKTGEVIENVHKDYPGFYHLVYETPTAAADGSTVIQVYYDRNYYLMEFELNGGYGVDPIYDRYGADISVRVPTRVGYEFAGWLDSDNKSVSIPSTMPADNVTFHANWRAQTAQYTVTYWIVNDDGTRSLIGSHIDHTTADSLVSGKDDLGIPANLNDPNSQFGAICGSETNHVHVESCYSCGSIGHKHTTACVNNLDPNDPGDDGRAVIQKIQDGKTNPESGYIYVIYSSNSRQYWPKLYLEDSNGKGTYYVVNSTQGGYTEESFSGIIEGDAIGTAGTYNELTAYKYKPKTDCAQEQHIHTTTCRTCVLHSHTASCYQNKKHLEYVESVTIEKKDGTSVTYKTDKDVTVNGNGTTIVNVYYTYKTYTIRFVYARQQSDGLYHLATLTNDGRLENGEWHNAVANTLPDVTDPNGNTERQSFEEGGYTYYYIALTAKYGENITDKWPSANVGNVMARNGATYNWGSWAAAAGTGYRKEYGDAHANIVGPYPVMSDDMTVENPIKLEDGTYLAQNMNAWWGSGQNITKHAYHNYFEVLPGEQEIPGETYKTYNGKKYKLEQTYTFTAAHNGSTRVDPVQFDGFKVVNEDKKKQENSQNYNNNGNCEICGTGCRYCNDYLYDAITYKLSFWNHDDYLVDGEGSQVPYRAPLKKYFEGSTVGGTTYEGANTLVTKPEKYPKSLEPDAYQFEDWYTSPNFEPDTLVDPETITMPAEPVIVYAKWVPIPRTVKFYLTRDSLDKGITIPQEMEELWEASDKVTGEYPADSPYDEEYVDRIVLNGSLLNDIPDPSATEDFEDVHPRTGYQFIGWFYLNDAGKETAFDPNNIPVTQDLNLYAKWSANTMCAYNVYFALDANKDNQADRDTGGNIIYVAAPITGTALAGRTYTFTAKGGDDLYDPEDEVNYREGYFPKVGSHSLVIFIGDEDGTAENSFTFLYQPQEEMPYTVQYLEKGTSKVLATEKTVSDNKKVVVTEYFQPVAGYMPDAYQKMLVVTLNANENVITFWYEKDEVNAMYAVNHFVQDLNPDLSHRGWRKRIDLQYTGIIGQSYSADAINIEGFTLSQSYTDGYNRDMKNGFDDSKLPTEVSLLTDRKLTGTLAGAGMELNFYYTRNLYPYEFRFMLNGTTTQLAAPITGIAAYDTTVSMVAPTIEADLDGDGIMEDFRLYDPTQTSEDIHIILDGEPLPAGTAVTAGQAKVNVATFYYTRCTQDMTIRKNVVDNGNHSNPDPDQDFTFSLRIHAKDGYHRSSYDYSKSDGTTGTLSPSHADQAVMQFTLKAGQTITIQDLPTAEYTITEQNLPVGYYLDSYAPAQTNTLTVDSDLNVVVTNQYDPTTLKISKLVNEVETNNQPEREDFTFTVTFPAGVTPASSYAYTVNQASAGEEINRTAYVTNGSMEIVLRNNQTAQFENLPLGTYTIQEADYSEQGYQSSYLLDGEANDGSVTLARGNIRTFQCVNAFPVGNLKITKTVTKEFGPTPWNGDSFTFTVKRTTEGRPLIQNNTYDVYAGENKVGTATVNGNQELPVTISFTGAEAAGLQDGSLSHTLTIKSLPYGTYSVTEAENTDYLQSERTVNNLVLTGENTPEASFTNKLLRPTGKLNLEKELVKAEGYTGDLDENTQFSFTIELLEEPPESVQILVDYSYADPQPVAMANGRFTVLLRAKENVTVTGLPIGTYRIVEATVPRYANGFFYLEDDEWKPQDSLSMADGQLYTEVQVEKDETAEGMPKSKVLCRNTFPVDRAELIIQKLVTQENDLDVLPEDTFRFTVTLAADDFASYAYQIYNLDGTADGGERTATVTNKAFTVDLKAGQYAVIPNMPVCGYQVVETKQENYNRSYQLYQYEYGNTPSTTVNTSGQVIASGTESESTTTVDRTFLSGKTDLVVFTNEYKSQRTDLTIDRNNASDSEQVYVYQIQKKGTNEIYTVTVTGNGSTTIYDLPYGTYTVTQMNDWSWRFNDGTKEVTLAEDQPGTLIFGDAVQNQKWLDGNSNLLVNTKKEAAQNEP